MKRKIEMIMVISCDFDNEKAYKQMMKDITRAHPLIGAGTLGTSFSWELIKIKPKEAAHE